MLQKRLDSQISTLVKTVKVPVKGEGGGGGEALLQKSMKTVQWGFFSRFYFSLESLTLRCIPGA